jgi:hypothetical protein
MTVAVRDFGAVGNGSTDDTAAVQGAIDSAAARGDTVVFAPGRYRVAALRVPDGVSLEGVYTFSSPTSGSWLHCVDREAPAITLGSGTSVRSLGFFWPEQRWDHQRSAPLHAYPPALFLVESARRVLVRDVLFVNAYEGIDADRHHEYLILQNVQGYCIHRGVVEDFSSDIDRWTTVHFNMNCFWMADDPDVDRFAAWTRRHGTAFTIRRADWLVMFDCFCWGYRTGVRLEESPAGHGTPSGVHIMCSGFDACGACIEMTAGWGVRVSDSFFVSLNAFDPGADCSEAAVMVTGGGEVGLTNCRWWGCEKGAAVLHCSNSVVEGNGFTDYGRHGEHEGREYAALVLGRGVHQVRGNQFNGVRFHEGGKGPARIPGAHGIDLRSSATGAIVGENYFTALAGGSVRIEAGLDNVVLHGNVHRGSAPPLAVGGVETPAPADLCLGDAQ